LVPGTDSSVICKKMLVSQSNQNQELTFNQTRTVTILASHMTNTRCIRRELYVKR